MLGCLALLVAGPYFRGLFFPMEQMVALLLVLGLFCGRSADKFRRGDGRFLAGPLDWAVAGLVLAYLASTAVAANVRGAVQEDMKVLLYFLFYWLIRDLTAAAAERAEAAGRARLAVVAAVAVTGFWLSVLGVGAAAGTFRYNGAFDGWRIYSALQYPNTLAAYLTASLLCLLALWTRTVAAAWYGVAGAGAGGAQERAAAEPSRPAGAAARRGVVTAVLGAALAAVLLVFVFTYSRGAWLILPPVALLFVLLVGRGLRLVAALGLGVAVAGTLPAAPLLAAGIAAKSAGSVWLALLAALAVGGALGAGAALMGRLGSGTRAAGLMAVGVALVGGAAAAVVVRGLPAAVLERARTISLREYDAWSRLVWNLDALKIVRDHPLLGAGGRGWDALYHQYQSYGYWTTEVHNGFMQTWVEAGTVGFLVLLVAWGAFAAALGRVALARLRGAGEPAAETGAVLAVGAGSGALALGLHSLIDFNLSLSAVSLALWALMAVVASAAEAAEAKTAESPDSGAGRAEPASGRSAPGPRGTPGGRRPSPWLPVAVYGGAILVAVGVLTLLAGFQAGQAGARALNERDPVRARQLFERAVRSDPLTASFHVDLAQAYLAAGAGPVEADRAEAELRRAIRLERGNPNYHAMLGTLLLQLGRAEEGLAELRRAVELHPFEARWYVLLVQADLAVARARVQAGDRGGAEPLLRDVEDVAGRLRRQSGLVPPLARGVFPTPATTPELDAAVAEARRLLGQGG